MCRKTLNIVLERAGVKVVIIRGAKIRRYWPTSASLARCRCLVRNSIKHEVTT